MCLEQGDKYVAQGLYKDTKYLLRTELRGNL